jgi:hypothetical protein
MNERIRELAEQLGYNVDFEPSDDETDRSYQVISNDFAEKFAELIVKECCEVVRYIDAVEIKKHFGVK